MCALGAGSHVALVFEGGCVGSRVGFQTRRALIVALVRLVKSAYSPLSEDQAVAGSSPVSRFLRGMACQAIPFLLFNSKHVISRRLCSATVARDAHRAYLHKIGRAS